MKKKLKKHKYFEPGLLPNGYEQEEEEAEEMNIYDEIEEAIAVRRDDQQNKGGVVDKAFLTTFAPMEIQALAGDNQVWVVSNDPLQIRIGDSQEIIDIKPDWIVLENIEKQNISALIKRQVDIFMGLNEIDSGSPSSYNKHRHLGVTKANLAYSKESYSSPKDAYKILKDTSKEVSSKKQIDSKTLKHFLKNVYKGGDHSVSYKKMVKFLISHGICINDRREQRVAKLEKVRI